jgi:hypothetical protein
MAAQFFNRISQLGVGVALTAGVINSALYNGELFTVSIIILSAISLTVL